MTRYIALLRGINVGGNKNVPMAQLRALLEGLGHGEIATLLQSGNAVFSSKERSSEKVAAQLEKAIEKAFGFEVPIILRTRDELAQAIAQNPLSGAEDDPSKFLVLFLSAAPDPKKLAALEPAKFLPDEFRVVGREIYGRFPNGIGNSKLAAALTSPRIGAIPTGRNWATVTKLLALADGEA